jgi:hypothetical protein
MQHKVVGKFSLGLHILQCPTERSLIPTWPSYSPNILPEGDRYSAQFIFQYFLEYCHCWIALRVETSRWAGYNARNSSLQILLDLRCGLLRLQSCELMSCRLIVHGRSVAEEGIFPTVPMSRSTQPSLKPILLDFSSALMCRNCHSTSFCHSWSHGEYAWRAVLYVICNVCNLSCIYRMVSWL